MRVLCERAEHDEDGGLKVRPLFRFKGNTFTKSPFSNDVSFTGKSAFYQERHV
jgi:hypothetical protein